MKTENHATPAVPAATAAPAPKAEAPKLDPKLAKAIAVPFAHAGTRRTVAQYQLAEGDVVHLFSATGVFVATANKDAFATAANKHAAAVAETADAEKKAHDAEHKKRVDEAATQVTKAAQDNV